MELILVLLGIVVVAIPIAVIALIVGQSNLRNRLAVAERRIAILTRKSEEQATAVRVEVKEEETTKPEPAQPEPAKKVAGLQVTEPPKEILVTSKEPAVGLESGPLSGSKPKPKENAIPPALPKTQPELLAEPAGPTGPLLDSAALTLGPFFKWLQLNWFYVASAFSLALAGVFLVQYGMENGLLPPRARVAAALAFGGVLIGVGEFIRRRFGDGAESVTAYLPSVFSGAGIVTLFAAVLSARMLYDLIGGGMAMSGMVATAGIAMFLGWLHGPLLVAVGVIGAFAAPVVLGSSNSNASPLFGYFAIITIMGLAVDTIRRWAWISVLTMVLAFVVGFSLWVASDYRVDVAAALYFSALPLLAILIPSRGVVPDHGGPTVLERLLAFVWRPNDAEAVAWPTFPTLLAYASVAASAFVLFWFSKTSETTEWLGLACLFGLTAILVLWSKPARALQDMMLFPAGTMVAYVWTMGVFWSGPFTTFNQTYELSPEAPFPWAVTILVVMGCAVSVLAAWRSLQNGKLHLPWAIIAAVFAPAMAIVVETSWTPDAVIGQYAWALHAAGIAAVMAFIAERFAKQDADNRLRTSFALMAGLASMSFAFVILFSSAALTIALAVTVLAAAFMDRLWTLKPMQYFVAVGVVTLGYRLVVDPGLSYGQSGPLMGVLLAYGGTLVVFLASLYLLKGKDRATAQVMLDSAAWSTGGMLVSLLIYRVIVNYSSQQMTDSHWALGINAAIWIGLALAQLQRLSVGGALWFVRAGLAMFFGLIGGMALLGAVSTASPLNTAMAQGMVLGPPLFNTLIAAYLLPALVLFFGAGRLTTLDERLRIGLAGIGLSLAGFWLVLVVRHFWQGADGMVGWNGVTQSELYSYTIMLLVLGAGLFYQSLSKANKTMRLAGLIVIGLAVAKVFLIDITGLEGLTRVFSLLVLGLSLAALAWLNRWAQSQEEEMGTPPDLPQ